jgi:hypothetical protein
MSEPNTDQSDCVADSTEDTHYADMLDEIDYGDGELATSYDMGEATSVSITLTTDSDDDDDDAADSESEMASDGNGTRLCPTHECRACGCTKQIDSAPTSELQWCDTCERIRTFDRL